MEGGGLERRLDDDPKLDTEMLGLRLGDRKRMMGNEGQAPGVGSAGRAVR